MTNPEGEGYNGRRERQLEQHRTLRLTGHQLEAVIIAIHRDLTESTKRLDAMKAEDDRETEYDVLASHVSGLQSALEALRAAINA